VPPIYQPEVAARGIVAAADHPHRREHWIGSSTVATLLANAVVPGVLDRYLGRTGFDAQQTNDPASPEDPSNLWAPVDTGADRGAHGRFGKQVIRTDPQPLLSRHHGLVAATIGVAAAFVSSTLGARHSPKEILDQARLAEQARACAICELSAHDPASP
jgi:hypothetical protein